MSDVKRITVRDVSGAMENLEYQEMKWDKIFDDVVLVLKDNNREHIIPLRNLSRLSHRPEPKTTQEPSQKTDKK